MNATAEAQNQGIVESHTLRELRLEMGLTQTEIGQMIGISKEQVCRIESGDRNLSRSEQLVLSAALLGKPVPEFRAGREC